MLVLQSLITAERIYWASFFLNQQKSEVLKMVCFAIVACIDLALRIRIVTAIQGFWFCFSKDCPEFREIAATIRLRSAGSRHATLAK